MTSSAPVDVTGTSVYQYAEELIVELTGRDSDGDIVVISYQFGYAESGVVPKQPVDSAYEPQVRSSLAAAGYDWGDEGPETGRGER